ncbi:MAG TPA: cytochrome c-type biogenesis CcmF C-terminal domain-containing protein [Bacillota bacterium]|jgi:cytochrome c-type biogenesis protein CcmF
MAELGSAAIIIGLIVAVYSVIALAIGAAADNPRVVGSGRGGVLATVLATSTASLSLLYLLVKGDFSVAYVADYSSLTLPWFYRISAFWAGQAGSLLLWLWLLSIYAAVVGSARSAKEPSRALLAPRVAAILQSISVFFFILLIAVAKPFAKGATVPTDGAGLNPLLENPGMVIHPVATYLGYVGFAVPFAFAVAALTLGSRPGAAAARAAWVKLTRKWTLSAWLFLSIGILTGMQWAYVELGWGGYWAWDPVENASLIPWLTGTALIHSVMMQERKGLFKFWNLSLVTVTFLLTIFGTYLTRSDVLSSVHAFGDRQMGYYFLGFLLLTVVFSVALVAARRREMVDDRPVEAYISKETSFLANNVLLAGTAFVVFWGTIFPVITRNLFGREVAVGPDFYNRLSPPLGLAIVVLAGLCPLLAWRRASLKSFRDNFLVPLVAALAFIGVALILRLRPVGAILAFAGGLFVAVTVVLEFVKGTAVRVRSHGENPLAAFIRLTTRNRRRHGGYLVHLAVAAIIIGITGSSASSIYKAEATQTLTPGQSLTVAGYTVTFKQLQMREAPNHPGVVQVYADTTVAKGGRQLGNLEPMKLFYPNREEPGTDVAILGGLGRDVYVILAGWDENTGAASLKVMVNPLVAWIWVGGYLLIFGAVFALWPQARGVEVAEYEALRRRAVGRARTGAGAAAATAPFGGDGR